MVSSWMISGSAVAPPAPPPPAAPPPAEPAAPAVPAEPATPAEPAVPEAPPGAAPPARPRRLRTATRQSRRQPRPRRLRTATRQSRRQPHLRPHRSPRRRHRRSRSQCPPERVSQESLRTPEVVVSSRHLLTSTGGRAPIGAARRSSARRDHPSRPNPPSLARRVSRVRSSGGACRWSVRAREL